MAREALQTCYAVLTELLHFSSTMLERKNLSGFSAGIRHEQWTQQLVACTQRIHPAIERSSGGRDSEQEIRLKKNIHDVRGGALTVLVMELDWISMLTEDEIKLSHLSTVFFVSRDHLKIMRNCFYDLDEERRSIDLNENPHSTDLKIEKWSRFESETKRLIFKWSYSGPIASCCMEFSTLDRVIYNLINNAFTHGEGDTVEFFMLPDNEQQPENLFLAVKNKLSAQGESRLDAHFGREWFRLFEGGFSTNGTGAGLKICADCVSRAYKIPSLREMVAKQIVGINQHSGDFFCWVFWPLMPRLR
ncbi:MAG: hypothetical protein PF795_06705 [Kiritimatiellae bacterium]|nr:hypothetical protein [Kiritimatiellia bacterium]